MYWTEFVVLTLLIFDGNSDTIVPATNGHKKETDAIQLTGRFKRGLFGFEDAYFRQYYTEKGLGTTYDAVRSNRGTISDWGRLGSTSYTDAIRQSTNYYKTQAAAGNNVGGQLTRVSKIIEHREQDASRYPNSDRGHQMALRNWRQGQDRIQEGVNLSRCGNGRRKKRRVRFGRWMRPRVSSSRSSSGWLFSRGSRGSHQRSSYRSSRSNNRGSIRC